MIACILRFAIGATAEIGAAQAQQNPSPMVEHARSHARLKPETPDGIRFPLSLGTLFIPRTAGWVPPVLIHFHGAPWIPEIAAAALGASVISIQIGSGSSAYARPFSEPGRFRALIAEAEAVSGIRFGSVGLTAWSAGYGAVREILKQDYERVQILLLLDSLHAGYVSGRPGPAESALVTGDLDVFIRFARDAAAGRKRFTLTHTEIFPGTFASTTETADHLLKELSLRRRPILRWGPVGTQILSEARKRGFHVLGFAGNTAPDHVDLLHALPQLLVAMQRK